MKEKHKKKRGPIVYLPDGDLNFSNFSNKPPKTQYEERRRSFNRNAVKKLTGGLYGRDGKNS